MSTFRFINPYMFMLCMILTHTLAVAQQKPQINSPEFFGVRPGKYFFYTIPVSGSRPMEIDSRSLPKGVSYDKKKGIISGSIAEMGKYQIEISASNKSGSSKKYFTIVAGDQLALTPPMGWSSWYSYGRKAKEDDIL